MIFMVISAIAATVFGLSGAAAVSSAKEKFDLAASEYRRLVAQSELVVGYVNERLALIGNRVNEAVNNLQKANHILAPLEHAVPAPKIHDSLEKAAFGLAVLEQSSLVVSDFYAAQSTAMGLGVGSAVAAGSWAAVSQA